MGSARCRATPALNQSGGGGESFNHFEEVSPTRFRVAPKTSRNQEIRILDCGSKAQCLAGGGGHISPPLHVVYIWLVKFHKGGGEEEEEEFIENRTRVRLDFNEVAPARCRSLFRIVHSRLGGEG